MNIQMSGNDKEEKKRRFWEFDPKLFDPLPEASRLRRLVIDPLKSLGKYALFGLSITYPLYLILLGIFFGGLVFWGTLVGSAALIGFILWRTGYSKNYAAWNSKLSRQLLGISGGFVTMVAFILSLKYLNLWTVIPVVILAVLGLILVLRKKP